jgi:peptide-methionine (S)-S-oxide reductase
MFQFRRPTMPDPAKALPGRATPITTPPAHFVNGRPITPPWPEGYRTAVFGLGCFWGAEKDFWETPGVWTTAVGYAGGYTPNPTYEEACSGKTGHAEVVLVVYDPAAISYEQLLKVFWEHHVASSARAMAAVLCGTVTLAPAKPSAGIARTRASNSSGVASIAS